MFPGLGTSEVIVVCSFLDLFVCLFVLLAVHLGNVYTSTELKEEIERAGL